MGVVSSCCEWCHPHVSLLKKMGFQVVRVGKTATNPFSSRTSEKPLQTFSNTSRVRPALPLTCSESSLIIAV